MVRKGSRPAEDCRWNQKRCLLKEVNETNLQNLKKINYVSEKGDFWGELVVLHFWFPWILPPVCVRDVTPYVLLPRQYVTPPCAAHLVTPAKMQRQMILGWTSR